jgi:hypothetical protein
VPDAHSSIDEYAVLEEMIYTQHNEEMSRMDRKLREMEHIGEARVRGVAHTPLVENFHSNTSLVVPSEGNQTEPYE